MSTDRRERPVRSRLVQTAILVPIVFIGSLAVGLLATNSELYQDLIGQAGAPQAVIGESDARTAAMAKLSELHPGIRGWLVERLERQTVVSVSDSEGLLRAEFSPAIEGWVFELRARGGSDFKVISGLVVVNAVTGEVEAADVMEYNP